MKTVSTLLISSCTKGRLMRAKSTAGIVMSLLMAGLVQAQTVDFNILNSRFDIDAYARAYTGDVWLDGSLWPTPVSNWEHYSDPLGAGACRIGAVTEQRSAKVLLKSTIGAQRILDMSSGEQLPRIC